MTGIEALSLLKDGKTLRRESWEPHEKCKALDFFGQWIVHLIKEHDDEKLDKELESIFQNSFTKNQPHSATFNQHIPRVNNIKACGSFISSFSLQTPWFQNVFLVQGVYMYI